MSEQDRIRQLHDIIPEGENILNSLAEKGFVEGPPHAIRIIKIPDGSAPIEFREQWIGVIILGARKATERLQAHDWTADQIVKTSTRWVVDGSIARICLGVQTPSTPETADAMRWFRENGPQMFNVSPFPEKFYDPDYDYLVFPGEVVEVLDPDKYLIEIA